jgi:small conductance mechanosensitive channel
MQPLLDRWATQALYAIPNIILALVIFVGGLFLARLLAGLLRGFLHRRGVVPHVIELLARAVYWTIVTVGVVMALQRFFDITAFLAGLGIVGFTVGFALQDVMKNFAAGIILLMQQPFRVGEAISVAGYEGTILAIDLRATEMSSFDGRLVSIPNAMILTNPIINFTRAPRRRVDVALPLPPESNVEAARRVVLDALRHAPGAVSDPAPTVVLEQIGADSAKLSGSFWVDITRATPETARDGALTRILSDLHILTSDPSSAATPAGTARSDGQQSD